MKEILIGIIFTTIGFAFFWGSLSYDYGSLSLIGPGYYPGLVSVILILVGLFIIAKETFWKS